MWTSHRGQKSGFHCGSTHTRQGFITVQNLGENFSFSLILINRLEQRISISPLTILGREVDPNKVNRSSSSDQGVEHNINSNYIWTFWNMAGTACPGATY